MAKRWINIEINGKAFELDTKVTVNDPIVSYKSVDDVYGRPSNRKRVIFENWLNWFVANGGYCGVASYNCNFFTIDGFVYDNETMKQYYCHITPAHNRCYEIV